MAILFLMGFWLALIGFLSSAAAFVWGALRFAAPRHGRVSSTRIRACGGLGADGPHLMLVGQRLQEKRLLEGGTPRLPSLDAFACLWVLGVCVFGHAAFRAGWCPTNDNGLLFDQRRHNVLRLERGRSRSHASLPNRPCRSRFGELLSRLRRADLRGFSAGGLSVSAEVPGTPIFGHRSHACQNPKAHAARRASRAGHHCAPPPSEETGTH